MGNGVASLWGGKNQNKGSEQVALKDAPKELSESWKNLNVIKIPYLL